MIQIIAGVLGVIVIVLQALWKNRQRAKELENDPVEDVRQTQIAATAGVACTPVVSNLEKKSKSGKYLAKIGRGARGFVTLELSNRGLAW